MYNTTTPPAHHGSHARENIVTVVPYLCLPHGFQVDFVRHHRPERRGQAGVREVVTLVLEKLLFQSADGSGPKGKMTHAYISIRIKSLHTL